METRSSLLLNLKHSLIVVELLVSGALLFVIERVIRYSRKTLALATSK